MAHEVGRRRTDFHRREYSPTPLAATLHCVCKQPNGSQNSGTSQDGDFSIASNRLLSTRTRLGTEPHPKHDLFGPVNRKVWRFKKKFAFLVILVSSNKNMELHLPQHQAGVGWQNSPLGLPFKQPPWLSARSPKRGEPQTHPQPAVHLSCPHTWPPPHSGSRTPTWLWPQPPDS